jgi:hypothetical protein
MCDECDRKKRSAMDPPKNVLLPFFAYGVFRPGQLAFFQVRQFVDRIVDPATVHGILRVRDGLPILEPDKRCHFSGALLTFQPDHAEEAYNRISAMEPRHQYKWDQVNADGLTSNALIGRSPKKGSQEWKDGEWNGWNDPLFTIALEVVEETLESPMTERSLKSMFRLQMAYLLLWSSIERYVSLRYHLGDEATKKVDHLADEPAFVASLRQHVGEPRDVYSANEPDKKLVLAPDVPKKAVKYYYQLRCNITHRGKGVALDYDRIRSSLAELLPIFREVLQAAKCDAGGYKTASGSG